MYTKKTILDFIKNFDDAQDTFLNSCCYWFAHILHTRFPQSKIVLAIVENHFLTNIDNKLYDITGDVTEQYRNETLVEWDAMDAYDPLQKERVVRDCILKIEVENQ